MGILSKSAFCQISRHPFPHAISHNIFSAKFYRKLISNIPDSSLFELGNKRSGNPASQLYRRRIKLTDSSFDGWRAESATLFKRLRDELTSEKFAKSMIELFKPAFVSQYGTTDIKTRTRLELIRDCDGYQIPPHTDSPSKIITLLFYLPRDSSMRHLGTSLYVPKQEGFTDWKGKQLDFDMFDVFKTVEYLPNTMFGFMKTNNSFHGRPLVANSNGIRDWMNCSIQIADQFLA